MADYHVKRALSVPIFLYKTNIVRMKGLEPPRLSAPDPKSGTATNYATSAKPSNNGGQIYDFSQQKKEIGLFFTDLRQEFLREFFVSGFVWFSFSLLLF